MPAYHLAQLNIAWMKAPLESPDMADFVANLERINALAEGSPGYVWRLQDEAGDATAIRPFGDEVLVNMSLCLLYTSPSPRDATLSRMPSSA